MYKLPILKATDSLETWLSFLEKSHFKPIDMGLTRIRAVATELDLLHPAPYIITVAGTNGKGSTCKFIETALLKMGLRVGVYSSPHILCYNERVRVQGQMLTDEQHTASFFMIEQQKSQSLTYFEFSTLSALQLFKQAKLDVVILEVGLGGRLDATNIVDPNLAVITSIDLDHIDLLGDNRELIGREKAGIFRPHIPVVIGEPDCPQSVLNYAQTLNCQLFQIKKQWDYSVKSNRLDWLSNQGNLINLPYPQIPLANVATGLAVLTQLPFTISSQVMIETVAETQLIGRFQTLTTQQLAKFSDHKPFATVIIDVGHNPHAARYLATRLTEIKQPQHKIKAIFSVLADKDLTGIVEPLALVIDEWHCTGLTGYRGQSGQQVLEKLQAVLTDSTAAAYSDIKSATQAVFSQSNQDDIILIFGSFYVVSGFLQFLDTE